MAEEAMETDAGASMATEPIKSETAARQVGAEGQQELKSTPARARPSSSNRAQRDSPLRPSPGGSNVPAVEYLFGCSKCRFLKAGCSRCVTKPLAGRPRARWVPARALPQEGIPSCPTFHPTPEEFADPYAYIARIKEQAAAAGICMVVPPAGWAPPSMLRDPVTGQLRDDLRFPVRRQPTHLLCRRYATADGGPEEAPKASLSPAAAAEATVAHDGIGPLPLVPDGTAGGAAAAAGAAPGVGAGPAAMDVDVPGSAQQEGPADPGQPPAAGPSAAVAGTAASAPGGDAAEATAAPSVDGAVAEAADGAGGGAAVAAASTGIHPAAGGAAGGAADASSSSDDEDAAFGYDHLDRNLSVRQFQRYAAWAKRQHFSEPFCPTATQPPPRLAPKTKGGSGAGRGGKAPRRNVIEVPEGGPDWGVVEAEFWRIVEDGDCQVESLYGQDVDTATYGSGFPTAADVEAYVAKRETAAAAARAEAAELAAALAAERGADSSGDDADDVAPGKEAGGKLGAAEEDEHEAALRKYAADAWNLNNLPHGSGSVLKYVKEDIDGKPITGIMVPWLYVGSMFSAFCWHIEDHGLYSINYLHEGAPKIWYGVPAHAAKKMEAAMRDALPHLFDADPGLMHRLVTMLSPKQLVARGVPVCRAVHAPGTFVITFPDAYHGGFNSGYNVAEAVNFACPDWLPFGTDSIARYRAQHRPMTFSHDALLVHLVEGGLQGLQQQQQEGKEGQHSNVAPALHQQEQQGAGAAVKAELQPKQEQEQEEEEEYEPQSWEVDFVQLPGPSNQQQGQQQQHQQQQQLEWRPWGAVDAEPLWDRPATAAEIADAAAAAGPASSHAAGSMRAAGAPMRAAPVSMRTVAAPNAPKAFMPAANGSSSGHHHHHHHHHKKAGQRERKYTMRGGAAGANEAQQRPPPPPPSRELLLLAVGELAVRAADERRLQAVAALVHGVGAIRTMLGERMGIDPATGVHVNTQGVECRVCSSDLYASAVVSSRMPGQAVCAEHAAALGVEAAARLLLVRHAPGVIGVLLRRAVAALGREGRQAVAVARVRAAAAAAAHAAEAVATEAKRQRRVAQQQQLPEGQRPDAHQDAHQQSSSDASADAATAKAAAAAAKAATAAIRSIGPLYHPAQLSRSLFVDVWDDDSQTESELGIDDADDDNDDEPQYLPGVLYSYSSPTAKRARPTASMPADGAADTAGGDAAKRKRRRRGAKAGVLAHAEAEQARAAVDPAAEQAFLEREQEFLASQGIRKRRGAIAAQHHMRALLEYLT